MAVEQRWYAPRVPPTGARIPGGGPVVPPGAFQGNVLWWNDGAGQWEASAAPVSVGTPTERTFLFWDGSGYQAQLFQVLPSGTVAGERLEWDGVAWVPVAPTGGSILMWGDGALGTGNNTRYPSPGWDMSTGAATNVLALTLPRAGRLQGLYYRARAGGADELTATVWIAGAPTALALTVPALALTAEETATSVNAAAGQALTLEVTRPNATNPNDYFFTLNYF